MSDVTATHLPYGSVVLPSGERALAVRVGAQVLDCRAAARAGLLPEECDAPDLDRLLAAPSGRWTTVRAAVEELLGDERRRASVASFVHDLDAVRPVLPFTVGDFVDFYASEAHATNVGRLFRPDADPLLPNWKHLPVGYHGRSGTVCASGTEVVRPSGLRVGATGADGRSGEDGPTFGPSRRLDLELELAWVLGGRNDWGRPVPIDAVEDHVFGVALCNDWSARDVQAYEYVPLGPFLGKSFATSIGLWITPLEALQGAKLPRSEQTDPRPAEYLQTVNDWHLDIELEVLLSTPAMRDDGVAPVVLARSDASNLYWSIPQQFAHLSVNGASIRPGDLCATGTISGWDDDARGCLLELTRNGAEPVALPKGETRTYLEDGDEVTLRGAALDGAIELAEVVGRISPAV
jgi:fumarylacetoacetase